MKVSDMVRALERIQENHGDVYVSIRHTANNDFSPEDDLTDIGTITYDKTVNMAVIRINN